MYTIFKDKVWTSDLEILSNTPVTFSLIHFVKEYTKFLAELRQVKVNLVRKFSAFEEQCKKEKLDLDKVEKFAFYKGKELDYTALIKPFFLSVLHDWMKKNHSIYHVINFGGDIIINSKEIVEISNRYNDKEIVARSYQGVVFTSANGRERGNHIIGKSDVKRCTVISQEFLPISADIITVNTIAGGDYFPNKNEFEVFTYGD